MRRLGYASYVAQGGDVGAGVTDAMSRQAPEGLIGVHTNLLVPALNDPAALPADTEQEKAALAAIKTFGERQRLLRGAVHQAPDHRLRAAGLPRRARGVDGGPRHGRLLQDRGAFTDDKPSGNLTRDHILDNITTYWLTGTGASAARSYWEAYGPDAPAAGQKPLPASSVPFGFTTFPGEIWPSPRSWVEASYPNVVYFNEVDKGGHFAAWEEPQVFSEEVRAAFESPDQTDPGETARAPLRPLLPPGSMPVALYLATIRSTDHSSACHGQRGVQRYADGGAGI